MTDTAPINKNNRRASLSLPLPHSKRHKSGDKSTNDGETNTATTPTSCLDKDKSTSSSSDLLPSINSSKMTNNEPMFKFGPFIPIVRKDKEIIIDSKGIVSYYLDSDNPKSTTNCELMPDDAIVDAPSIINPILLKKKTKWPPKEVSKSISSSTTNASTNTTTTPTASTTTDSNRKDQRKADDADVVENTDTQNTSGSDECQVVKVVNDGREVGGPDGVEAKSSNNIDCTSNNDISVTDYIKSATMASLTHSSRLGPPTPILTVKDYFKSSAGEMLLGIGLSRVREWHLEDSARRLKSKIRHKGPVSVQVDNLKGKLASVMGELGQAISSNKIFKSNEILECPHCPFKTEFSVVMNGHLELPHFHNKQYLCNWCDFKVRDCNQIVHHNLIEHKKRCRIEKPPALHQCSFCFFETKSKRKLTTHLNRCQQLIENFTPLAPAEDEEKDYPAVTQKLITQQDVQTYEQTLKALRLAAYSPHQLKVSTGPQRGGNGANQRSMLLMVPNQSSTSQLSSAEAANNSRLVMTTNQRVLSMAMPKPNSGQGLAAEYIGSGTVDKTDLNQKNDANHSAQLLQLLARQDSNTSSNRASLVQHPRTFSPFANGKAVISSASIIMAPPNQINGKQNDLNKNVVDKAKDESEGSDMASATHSPNPKGSTFVICEICDGYIKDLSQLKSHMQYIHKVKIHQKMLISRPPLNCQKCQWRFFTDQGLERHLLGAHGLVTSNMQELVDQGCDSGRCSICGRAYANKLVAHMREVHKSNLKPAHLSYKCTVCSATFNLYRLFESHVYSIHSESVKRISK